LPDGDLASLILPDGRVNTTPAGMEAPVMTVLEITERAPEKGATVNLLRCVPNMVTACGAEPNNPADAVKDGSYFQTPSLDNYWEHSDPNPLHRHALMIDLLKPYDLTGLEIFYAEEAGFSSHYNWRSFSVYGSEKDKSSLQKIMEVKNPEGRSCQRIAFPSGMRLRYIKIEVDQSGLFPESGIVRLAELILYGR